MKREGQKAKKEQKEGKTERQRERLASAMKVNAWECAFARDLESVLKQKHKCWAPKDGELCLRRANYGGGP